MVKIRLAINQEFIIDIINLLDIGTYTNCIREGLIPTQCYEKTTERLYGANHSRLKIKYKISNVHIYNQNICFRTTFFLVKDLHQTIILGTPFLFVFYPSFVDKT